MFQSIDIAALFAGADACVLEETKQTSSTSPLKNLDNRRGENSHVIGQ